MRQQRPRIVIAVLCAAVMWRPAVLEALELRVTQLRVAGTRLSAAFEVRDLVRDSFLELIRSGRSVFLQLEAGLWEDRRVFDRLVITIPPATWRIDRDPTGPGIVVQDQHGGSVRHADVRQPFALRVDLGPGSRVEANAEYYVHATLNAASVDERDLDRAGEAIFGDEQSARGLAGLGRFVFRTLLQMGKYFESTTTEVTSRRMPGQAIISGAI